MVAHSAPKVGSLFSIGFTMVPLQSFLFQKEGRQQWDISSECSIVRKACFPKGLQGFWANRVGAVFLARPFGLESFILPTFLKGFGERFFGQVNCMKPENRKLFSCYMYDWEHSLQNGSLNPALNSIKQR